MFGNEYISLDRIAVRFNLPKTFLAGLVDEGTIPYLDVNGKKRFIEQRVRDVLSAMEVGTKFKDNFLGEKNDNE